MFSPQHNQRRGWNRFCPEAEREGEVTQTMYKKIK
jgi:hypothetical protein